MTRSRLGRSDNSAIAPSNLATIAVVAAVIGALLSLTQCGSPAATKVTGTVRTTELQDSEVDYVLHSGARGSCAVVAKPTDPVIVVTLEWTLPDEPPADSVLRIDVRGPSGWASAGCLPSGSIRTAKSPGSTGSAETTTFETPAVDHGNLAVVFTAAKRDSIPDLEPWQATLTPPATSPSGSIHVKLVDPE